MTSVSTTAPGHTPPVLELHGESSDPWQLARAVWSRRELLVLLARKEFHVKYRRMSFGTMWAVVLPLLQSVVMAVVFSRLVRFSVPHYPVFMLSGMAGWTYFGAAFGAGSNAITAGSDLASKVYFPRALLSLVQPLTNLYGLAIMLAIVVVLCPALGAHLGMHSILLLPAIALLVVFTSALVLTTSALQVYFRDVTYIVNALVLLLMYVSPVIYPPSVAPSIVKPLIAINPLTGVLDLFHSAVGTVGGPLGGALAATGLWTALFVVLAVVLHSRFDRVFADLL